jgi:hypothetical protein
LTQVAIRNPNSRNGIQTEIPHLAIVESALCESILELSGEIEIQLDRLGFVINWSKISDGKAFLVPVAKCLQIIELGIQKYAMALPRRHTGRLVLWTSSDRRARLNYRRTRTGNTTTS